MSQREVQTITCKAAICWGPGEPLTVEDIQVEPPRASEVRVRILCASLCHTDILFSNGFPLALFPRILGHEGVGVVESVGEGVDDLKEGDTIIPTYIGECHECLNCTSGKTNLCLKYPVVTNGLMTDQTSRMSVKGQKLYHLLSCSTFSQYMVVNVNYATKVDSRVPLPHASLLSCGFSAGFGAVWKEAKIEKGSNVVVFGLGGVGMGAVAGAQWLEASKIIGVDLNENRKDKAKVLGMTHFINPKEIGDKSIAQVIVEMTGGLGVDYSFVCAGVALLVNEALEATIAGRGVTIVVGVPNQESVPINTMALIFGKTLKGTIFGGIKPHSDLPTIIDKCANKEFQLDDILTHEVGLDDINRAFELLKEPDCLKVVIKMDET